MVMEVARIVANLCDTRSEDLCEAPVLLQVDTQIGIDSGSDLECCLRFLAGVDRKSDHLGSSIRQCLDLLRGEIDVAGRCGAHALYDDRISRADGGAADLYRSGRVSWK